MVARSFGELDSLARPALVLVEHDLGDCRDNVCLDKIATDHGGIGGLVNNAGVHLKKPVWEVEPGEPERALDITDLKDESNLERVRALIASADVMIHKFRPGVMERIGLGHGDVSTLNPRLVYGVVTGYSAEGPWRNKPVRDLLVQALTGLFWLSGDRDDAPISVGFPMVDMAAVIRLVQGIHAALVRRGFGLAEPRPERRCPNPGRASASQGHIRADHEGAIRIDGRTLTSRRGAPKLGASTDEFAG